MTRSAAVLLVATHNRHKLEELRALVEAEGLELDLLSLAEVSELEDIEEDGKTFSENAAKKALVAGVLTGESTLADDSGLEVDHLNGLPGVRSSRYAGDGATDDANNIKLLTALQGMPGEKRTARFRSVVAIFVRGPRADQLGWELAEYWNDVLESRALQKLDEELLSGNATQQWETPWGVITLVVGSCEGCITAEPRGSHGFGYDPVFFYPPLGKTFGELSPETKNCHSHRARAFSRAVKVLREVF